MDLKTITNHDIDELAKLINFNLSEWINWFRFKGGKQELQRKELQEKIDKIQLKETRFYYGLYKKNNDFAEIVKLTLQIEWEENATINLETGLCKTKEGFEITL